MALKISVITPSIRPEGLAIVQKCLEEQTVQDFEWLVEVGMPWRGHDLNAAYNRLLRRAQGDTIVFYQDYIRIEKNGLELFWRASNQASPSQFFTAPVGKTLDWDHVEWDWRASDGAEMNWTNWEIDWACAPREALWAIGGFDETLDQYWSSDNVNVACRADLAGYKFGLLKENKAVAYDHDKVIKHPFRHKYNPDWNNERLDAFRRGLRLPPLSNC